MDRIEGILQVNSVTPGSIGGAIFSGRVIGQRRVTVCKANYKKITRTPLTGECWKIVGFKTKHDEYRNYVNIESCHLVSLPEAGYIKGFLLKHPAFRGFGFGERKVEKLINAFGAPALASALNNGKTEHLAEVVNNDIAEQVTKTWISLKNETETITFLVENNIPVELSKRIIRICSYNTVERLKKNPYTLVVFSNTVPSIWKLVDALGNKLGLPKNDPKRIVGAIEFSLYKRLEQGHTATPVETLRSLFKSIVDEKLFSEALIAAFEAQAVCSIKRGGLHLIQPIGAALIEQEVELRITEMINSPKQLSLNTNLSETIQRYSDEFEKDYGFSLNTNQKSAVYASLTNKLCVITGFGGTGKTTVLRSIVELADRPVFILALSGKAKERAREASGVETFTIHGFIRRLKRKLIKIFSNTLIIIDESSMVDIGLINQLFKALGKTDFSLVMLGDTGQLSPVGYGVFWHKLAYSTKVPVINLTQVHRTSSSELHTAAMSVRKGTIGNIPDWNGETKGIYFIACKPNKNDLCNTLIDIRKKINPDHQIITPHMYDGALDSGNTINKAIQISAHPEDTIGIYMGSFFLKVGDPVIVTNNNLERNLFNGNVGRLVDILSDSEEVIGVFHFFGKDYHLSIPDLWDLGMRLAYAISIHKSQGSEYDTTIVCTVSKSDFLERSMLYTAITRSKSLTLLVGDNEIARSAAERPNRSDNLCVGFDIISETA